MSCDVSPVAMFYSSAWAVKIYVVLPLARNIILFLDRGKDKLLRKDKLTDKSFTCTFQILTALSAPRAPDASKGKRRRTQVIWSSGLLYANFDQDDDDHLAKMSLQVSHKTSIANTPHLMIMIMKPWSVWPNS